MLILECNRYIYLYPSIITGCYINLLQGLPFTNNLNIKFMNTQMTKNVSVLSSTFQLHSGIFHTSKIAIIRILSSSKISTQPWTHFIIIYQNLSLVYSVNLLYHGNSKLLELLVYKEKGPDGSLFSCIYINFRHKYASTRKFLYKLLYIKLKL